MASCAEPEGTSASFLRVKPRRWWWSPDSPAGFTKQPCLMPMLMCYLLGTYFHTSITLIWKSVNKQTFITWIDKCNNNYHPPPALKNSTKNPLDKYLWSLSKYHVNRFSYTTQVKYKDIWWISFNLLMDCNMWNWRSLKPIQMSAIADCPSIEAEQKVPYWWNMS